MSFPIRKVTLFLAALVLAGCSGHQPETYHERLYVFGTLVDVTVYDAPEKQAHRVMEQIAQTFQRMHHDWHAWEPGPLTRINAAIKKGQPAHVIPSLIPVIKESKALSRRSEGLFNPAIGGLLNLWGFQSNTPPNGPPPSHAAVENWVRQAPSMEDVQLNGDVLVSSNQAVQLDFGAFAKGYAVDRAIDMLRAAGIQNAIVNAGGDLRAIGRHGDRPWRVGIRHPQGKGVLGSLQVSGDESVFTSGNYERYREYEGVHYTHILDPRTGMPVKGVTSVTVIHDNGAEADAAATALVVAGAKDWYRVAREMGIGYVMLVVDDGTVYMNPAMAARVDFQGHRPEHVILSKPLPH